MHISQMQEIKGGNIKFQVARFEDEDTSACYVKLQSQDGGLCTWKTSDNLRWNTGTKRGTPAIVRWRDCDFTDELMDIFAWVDQMSDGTITVRPVPVLDPGVARYTTSPKDSDRFDMVLNAEDSPSVVSIVLMRSFHMCNRRGFLAELMAPLHTYAKTTDLRSPFNFMFTWKHTPRPRKRSREEDVSSPDESDDAAAAEKSPPPSPGKKKKLDPVPASVTPDPAVPVLEEFHDSVASALRKFSINLDQQKLLVDMNLCRAEIWEHVNPVLIANQGIFPHVARALVSELQTTTAIDGPIYDAAEGDLSDTLMAHV